MLDSAGEKLRQVLKDLDIAKDANKSADLGSQTRELIRTHLAENQDLVRDLHERLRLSHDEGEMQSKRRIEVEKMLAKRDAAYEELLGESHLVGITRFAECCVDKTASSQSMAVADIKVSWSTRMVWQADDWDTGAIRGSISCARGIAAQ